VLTRLIDVLRTHRACNLLAVMGLIGWAWGIATWWIATQGHLVVGFDLSAYVRAGQDLVAGAPVYVGHTGECGAFNYAPPIAVLCAGLAALPGPLLAAAIALADVAILIWLVGDWRIAGLAFVWPFTVPLIVTGNIEILIAAAVVLAARGRGGPLVFASLTKIAPALALSRSQWRVTVLALAVALVVTLPWFHLWADWVAYLVRQPSSVPGVTIGPPWWVRLLPALALVALRRPWAGALAVVVAMPTIWLCSSLLLLAPIRLWLDAHPARTAFGPGRTTADPFDLRTVSAHAAAAR
jgi:hypothetical protein